VDEPDLLPADPAGLPEASAPTVVDLFDGDRYEIRIGPVAKHLGDETVRLLSYNGSVPGPTLRVPEGAEVEVTVHNGGDMPDTVHWHGLRLDNRYDGTHQVQHPIPVGGSFTYRLRFPDPGLYWYHPHIREDYGQELGLYGTILVAPADPGYWPPAHRDLVLTLDDILLEDGRVAPFSRSSSTFTAMGRFGNVLLVNGEPQPSLAASRGEVVRLHLVDTANTRVFNVGMPGARMKLVGGDSGRYEHERFVDSVVVAPSERAVVDVLFDQSGDLRLEHRTPDRTYELATFQVAEEPAEPALGDRFAELRTDPGLVAERERVRGFLDAEPDHVLALVAEMDLGEPEPGTDVVYTCPMHPEVRRDEPGSCPHCGMKLVPESLVPSAAHDTGHGHGGGHAHGAEDHAAPAGIEWEDDMVEMNRMTTPANMRWLIVDQATGARGRDIDWRFRVGDQVKVRIVNELASDHPMHHPFHFHGAGRFLVLARDGVAEDDLVWKDTVLVPTGQTVDLLLDVSNPGLWMAHCHIAEHHEGGMMFSFTVDP
jgi:FtsP/CotA-like multicopper oxidase with cupredoxin domain